MKTLMDSLNPRLSAVYSLGANRQHNFRASFQTGFRNPDTQAQFILFPTSSGTLIGGAKANAEALGIYEGGAWTASSWFAYLATGQSDPSVLVEANLDYVQPEELTAYEIGYKANINSNFFIDLNYYYNTYRNFIVLQTVASKNSGTLQGNAFPAGTLFRPYHNADEDISSQGLGFGLALSFLKAIPWKVITHGLALM